MTETFYKKNIYHINHSTYGGEITHFDIDGHHTMSSMAAKIMKDLAFDKRCKQNIEFRENVKKLEDKK